MSQLGPIGRLGHWTATHFRAVAVAWLVVAVALGVFAPRVEHALSGAGWEATGSESVQARDLDRQELPGPRSYGLMVVVHSADKTVADPAFEQAVADVAAHAAARATPSRPVVPPQPGVSISATATPPSSRPAPAKDPNDMVRAADDLKGPLRDARRRRRRGQPDRRARHVVGLQRGQQDGDDEVRAHLLAGDARHPRARLRLAGRRRAAADADDPRPRRRGRLAVPRHAAAATSRSGR